MKIQEVKAEERENAIFECVTSLPMSQVAWTLKNNPLSNSEKYEITVSEDKLIHRLKIIDCMPVDAGIYSAVAGLKSCSAWLVVEGKFHSTMYLSPKIFCECIQYSVNVCNFICMFSA